MLSASFIKLQHYKFCVVLKVHIVNYSFWGHDLAIKLDLLAISINIYCLIVAPKLRTLPESLSDTEQGEVKIVSV